MVYLLQIMNIADYSSTNSYFAQSDHK